MKTKIITTSSSGINYLSVPHNVTVIPDLICYSKNEEYLDYVEAQPEVFYNRFKMDLGNNPIIKPNTIEYIKKIVYSAKEAEYNQILFILPMSSLLDYKPMIELAMSEIEIEYYIYQSSLISYPLANVVLEADRLLKDGEAINNIVSKLDELGNNSNLYLFSPVKDLLSTISRITLDDDVLNYDKDGKIYTIDISMITEIKKDKKISPLAQLLNIYFKAIEGDSVLPFIVYSSRLSAYISFLEKILIKIYPRMKKVRAFPMPPALGVKIGCNAIGIGYIKKID